MFVFNSPVDFWRMLKDLGYLSKHDLGKSHPFSIFGSNGLGRIINIRKFQRLILRHPSSNSKLGYKFREKETAKEGTLSNKQVLLS